jgi:hypothetical protein
MCFTEEPPTTCIYDLLDSLDSLDSLVLNPFVFIGNVLSPLRAVLGSRLDSGSYFVWTQQLSGEAIKGLSRL